MSRSLFFSTVFAATCLFTFPAFAQKQNYFGKQFLLGSNVNGIPGWNASQGERFRLFAFNQRGAVGITKRLFIGLQNRVFWSKADALPAVQTWLGGGFARYYIMVPHGTKRRWALSMELGYYRGNHFVSQNAGTEGVIKKPWQSVPSLGISVERRIFKDVWIELAHNILRIDSFNFDAYPSIGILWHWGQSNAFAAPRSEP